MSEKLAVVRVVFALVGDTLNFDVLSAGGLPEPITRRRRGDAREGDLPPSPETIWAYEVKEESDSLERPISALLSDLHQFREQIEAVLQETGASAKLIVSVTIEEARPVYGLSAELIAEIAQFHVDLYIDIFDYSE